MHPNCRCSIAAWMDSEEYEEWLDYLDNGGTTEEWNRARTFSEKEGSKRKYKYKNAVVNTSAISSAGYRRKFTDITGENKISFLMNRDFFTKQHITVRHFRMKYLRKDIQLLLHMTGLMTRQSSILLSRFWLLIRLIIQYVSENVTRNVLRNLWTDITEL